MRCYMILSLVHTIKICSGFIVFIIKIIRIYTSSLINNTLIIRHDVYFSEVDVLKTIAECR